MIILGAVDEDTLALCGLCHEQYAHFLLNQNFYAESRSEFEKAHECCVKCYGKGHEQSLVLVNQMGVLSTLMGDFESAADHFKQAVHFSQDKRDKGVFLVNLGKTMVKQGRIKEAKEVCTRGFMLGKECDSQMVLKQAKECVKEAKEAEKKDGS